MKCGLWCRRIRPSIAVRRSFERYGFQKVKGLVAGGAERQASVWCGLQQVSPEMNLVVVHDGGTAFFDGVDVG